MSRVKTRMNVHQMVILPEYAGAISREFGSEPLDCTPRIMMAATYILTAASRSQSSRPMPRVRPAMDTQPAHTTSIGRGETRYRNNFNTRLLHVII